MDQTLKKQERLSDKRSIDRLVSKGKFHHADGLRYCVLEDNGLDFNRIMVSVPKKIFKRAVRRNLLKRRLREAYRTHKHMLERKGVDILFIYSTKDIMPYAEIVSRVEHILLEINS